MKYEYPAKFIFEDSTGGYSVDFPDFDDIYTCGDDMDDAIYMAGDALAFMLCTYEDEKRHINKPSRPEDIPLLPGESVRMISADTDEYRKIIKKCNIEK